MSVRKIGVAAAALVLGGMSVGAGAAPDRLMPRVTLVGGGETPITMDAGHASHPPLLVIASRAGTRRLLGRVAPGDQDLARRVDFRRSILVAALVDYDLPGYCRKNLRVRQVRVDRGRVVNAAASVEDFPGCMSVPEVTGVHLYSLATFPRRFTVKAPRAGRLSIRVVPAL